MNLEIIDCLNPLWEETLKGLKHDVYHLPEYNYLEAKRTNTSAKAFLLKDGERIFFVPYLLRSCNDIIAKPSKIIDIFDVTSAYGYPGILLSEAAANTSGFADAAINEFKYQLKSKGVCSGFFRIHPILGNNFEHIFQSGTFTKLGETISVDLTLAESEIWAQTRRGHQSTINKCRRSGMKGKIVPLAEYMDEFKAIYLDTMNRVKAKDFYYFDDIYFYDLLKLGDKIHLCLVDLEDEDEFIAACLVFECCGIVQTHLGGTKTQFLRKSPFNFLLHYVRLWAKERGNKYMHIGGGVGGSKTDSLYHFKSGFSRQRHNWQILRLVTDEEKYHYVLETRAKELNIPVENLLESNFFPAYRAPLEH